MPLHPDVVVDLAACDGSAIRLIGRTIRTMREAGVDEDAIVAYANEVHAQNFEATLATTRATVTVKE